MTGHSLGGAVAAILTAYMVNDGYKVERCVTFGQPKFTNADGVAQLEKLPITRVVDENDLVPMLPPIAFLSFGTEWLRARRPGGHPARRPGVRLPARARRQPALGRRIVARSRIRGPCRSQDGALCGAHPDQARGGASRSPTRSARTMWRRCRPRRRPTAPRRKKPPEA